MLNNTAFSGWEAREALKEARLKLEVEEDLCAGGCTPWKETEEGRQRFAELKKRFEEAEGDNSSASDREGR